MALTTTLRLTQFTVQKMQCSSGQGRATPYRITTYDGMDLGSLGAVMDSALEAGNATAFEQPGPRGMQHLLEVFSR